MQRRLRPLRKTAAITAALAVLLGMPVLPANAATMDGGWQEPVSLANPAAGWLASGCNGSTGYSTGLYHIGRDYLNPVGTSVKAISEGTVLANSDFGAGFARALFIKHVAQDGTEFVVLYGHVNSSLSAGAHVNAGSQVGTIAQLSGGDSHLHLGLVPGTIYPSSNWGRLACSNWPPNGQPSLNSFVDPIPFLSDHPAIGADTDGDGIPNANDWCPTVAGVAGNHGCPSDHDQDTIPDASDQCPTAPGASWNFGCVPPRQKMVADFNEDGKADYAAFYNYYSQGAGLWAWFGQASGQFTQPVQRWYQATGWGADRIIPAGAGDFNGDGHADIAAFYRYDGAGLGLHVWLGNGLGGFTAPNTAAPGWYTSPDWEGYDIVPMGAADYNGDGRKDIAAIYRYGGGLVHLFVWDGKANGTFAAPTSRWYSNAGWYGERVIPAGAGDFNGDGHADIAAFYRYDGGALGIDIWYGNGTGGFTATGGWYVASGWPGERIMPAGVGDFNLDGRMDIAAYFRYDGAAMALNAWYGRADGYLDYMNRWYVSRDWEGNSLKPAGAGDFNGDGRPDVTAFYNYGGGHIATWSWFGDGGGFGSLQKSWEQWPGWGVPELIV